MMVVEKEAVLVLWKGWLMVHVDANICIVHAKAQVSYDETFWLALLLVRRIRNNPLANCAIAIFVPKITFVL